jgi:type I restriction enzyme S subunit
MTRSTFNTVPLGELLEETPRNGYSPVSPDSPTGKWVLGLSALDGRGLDLSEPKPAPANDPLVDKFMLQPGDFLISRSNTFDKVGRVGVFRGGLENCSYPDLMMRFRPDPKKVNPLYLETYLKSDAAIKFIRQHATGTSGSMKKINQSTVESIPVVVPSITEQASIATVLLEWYEAIRKTEQLIAAKERRLHSLYQKLFGLASHTRQGWKAFQLGELLSPRKEHASPSDVLPLYSLTIEDGITPKTERYDREFLVRDSATKQYAVVKPGDIVFNPSNLRWGAIARSKVDRSVVVSPIYEVLSINEDRVNGALLAHELISPRRIAFFATKTEGTLIERMAVKLDTFLRTEVYFPWDLTEQATIAALLDEADREICLLRERAAALKTQKRGLMQKLLTGQWRLPVQEEAN